MRKTIVNFNQSPISYLVFSLEPGLNLKRTQPGTKVGFNQFKIKWNLRIYCYLIKIFNFRYIGRDFDKINDERLLRYSNPPELDENAFYQEKKIQKSKRILSHFKLKLYYTKN